MLPSDLHLFARGWMHGNCVFSDRGELIDTGYHTGVHALLAAVDGRPPLQRILLTHVHSDHAGGVAALVARTGAQVFAHADAAALVDVWDTRRLWLDVTGQVLPRFRVDAPLSHVVDFAGRSWRVIHTPGHATGGVAFFCDEDGVLISGDALWEDGLGVLDPWVDGEHVFSEAERALEGIAETGARVVIPGHGPAFTDLGGALERARSRLAVWHRDRHRLRRHVVRSGAGFWKLANPTASDAELARRTEEMRAAHPIAET